MFSVDWFSSNIQQWEKTLSNYYGKENCRALKIGSFEGKSADYICNNILIGANSKLTCVDTWNGSIEHQQYNNIQNLFTNFFNNMLPHIEKNKIEICRNKSSYVLPILLSEVLEKKRERYDFIYVDGSHYAKDCLFDLVLSFELLKLGGILLIDDYGWNAYTEKYKCPSLAIDNFISTYEKRIEILYKGYQVHIRKISDEEFL